MLSLQYAELYNILSIQFDITETLQYAELAYSFQEILSIQDRLLDGNEPEYSGT